MLNDLSQEELQSECTKRRDELVECTKVLLQGSLSLVAIRECDMKAESFDRCADKLLDKYGLEIFIEGEQLGIEEAQINTNHVNTRDDDDK